VSWGNTNRRQRAIGTQNYIKSAFGRYTVRLQGIRDGTSNTMFVAAVLQGAQFDVRGVMRSSFAGGGSYMTRFTPNKFQDYLNLVNGGDYLDQPIFCVSEPVAQLPCTGTAGDSEAFAASRSRHPGDVNVLSGDGGVRFIKDAINADVWRALNTIQSSEAISADAY
jgi:hypothetical protein